MIPDKTYRALREAKPQIALGVGVARSDGRTEILAEGPLSHGAERQVAADSRWHIGSITKTITATLAMQSVDRGIVALDQPIKEYLKDADQMDAGWHALTLRQLLSHTGGLAPNPPRSHFAKWHDLNPSKGRQKVLQDIWSKAPPTKTGEHVYSNLGYMLVGLILEQLHSCSWEALVKRQISEPLQLNSLGFGAPTGASDPWGHRKTLFQTRPIEPDHVASDNPRWLGPAGTVHMNIGDLLYYGRAHLQAARGELPAFLTQGSGQLMKKAVSANYGLGWVVQDDTIWHNGSNTMWYALLVLDLRSDSVVVVTQNAMIRTPQIDALAHEIVLGIR